MTINIKALAEDLATERLKPKYDMLAAKSRRPTFGVGHAILALEGYQKEFDEYALMFEDMIKKRVIL